MPANKTESSKYQSRYGGGFVGEAQFIAEIMCERLGQKNKQDLPLQFWQQPAWKKTFISQILAANSLLKLYKGRAIISALRKSPKVFSLRAPWLADLIQQEQVHIDRVDKQIAEANKVESAPLPAEKAKPVEPPR